MKNYTINFRDKRKPKIIKADYFKGAMGSTEEYFSFGVILKKENMDGSVSHRDESVFMIKSDIIESISVTEA